MADKSPGRVKRSLPTSGSAAKGASTARSKPRKVARKVAGAHTEDLLLAQAKVLETLSSDASLHQMLRVFAETIEQQSPDMLCSVLLLDGNTLRHGAAPNLPGEYIRAIDGASIGPQAGSCGTAAFTKTQVIVSDIATDPLWADYRHLALPHGLRACWSTPIVRANGEVLGTFALYYRQPRVPTERELQLLSVWTQLAALGISQKLAQESLEAEQRLLQDLFRTQEYERKLTSYELHDGIAQYAAGALMQLESYTQSHAKAAGSELTIVDQLLHKTLDESRRLINGLRPLVLDESGVPAAIEHLINEPVMAGPSITFEQSAKFPRLAAVLEAALFRIAQEALTNARKHSGSEKIEVVLKRVKQRVQLTVRDWGQGFVASQVSDERHGLRGIRERCRLLRGTVAIDSTLGKGTTISVDLPLVLATDAA